MSIGIKFKTSVSTLENLEKYINKVQKINDMQKSKDFHKFIQKKCKDTLDNYMTSILSTADTTNNDAIDVYISSNHIIETEDGFIMYNNAKIPANVKGIQNDISNYENGMFNLALAFEYGVGIIGMSTNDPNAWEYNVNKFKQLESNYGSGYNFGWILPKDVAEMYGIPKGQEFAGYRGLQIYRFTAEAITKMLPKWVKEYYEKKEV